MIENLRKMVRQETLAERRQRMIPAAAFGALIATAYVLTFFFVNVYTFPTLPLAIDWSRLLLMWIGFSAALALFGAIAAWFTEEYAGIVGGGLIITVIMSIIFLLSSRTTNSALTFQSIIMSVPLLGVAMLGAWGLRRAAHRYLSIQQDQKPDRSKRLTRHILTILLIGLVPGILMRMDLPSQRAIEHLHELLQAASGDSSVWSQLPLERVPALEDHFGMDYKIYARQSARSAGALDVTVRFSDGFTMSCLLPADAGVTFITQCSEGETLTASP